MTAIHDAYLSIVWHPLSWIFVGLTLTFFLVQTLTANSGTSPRTADDRLQGLAKSVGLGGLPPVIFLFVVLTWLVVALTLLFGLYRFIWMMVWQTAPTGNEELWAWRFGLAQIAALTTVLGAVIALPLTMARLLLTRRQTETSEQGHITDRINTAVQGLGAEKVVRRQRRRQSGKLAYAKGEDNKPNYSQPIMEEVSEPNLEVRIGAIYALERIAQDSDRDHVQIMEILCAYIRQNAPAPQSDDWPQLEMKKSEEDGPLEADWEERREAFREVQNKAKAGLKLREDIQVALTVLGRRRPEQRLLEARAGEAKEDATFVFDLPCPEYDGPEDSHDPAALSVYHQNLEDWKQTIRGYEGYRLDLRNADLRGADLSGLNFKGADLRDARLQGAGLWQARLQGAVLAAAQLQGARLTEAQMQGAVLWGAQLQEADLEEAQMQGAGLWLARLHGAVLAGARFNEQTDFTAATLRGAAVRSVDCSDVPQIAEHLQDMFGDASVTLPEGVAWPGHWPEYVLDGVVETEDGKLADRFDYEWHKWRADPDAYEPPEDADEG